MHSLCTKRLYSTAIISSFALFSLTLGGCVAPPASHWAKKIEYTCPFTPDESITTTATIAFQEIPNGDAIVQNQHMLETCMPNAVINWKLFDSASDILQAYGAGSIDAGLIGSSVLSRGISAPLNLDLVTPWVFDEIGTAESLVAKDPGIHTVSDLKGKTIAVAFSSTSHYSLLAALREAGLSDTTDVKLINLAADKMLAGWQSDQLDAAWVWDPTLSELEKNGHIIISSKDTAEKGSPTYDLATFTRSFAYKNPGFMSIWAKAQNEASKQINTQADTAAASISAVIGTDAQKIIQQLKGYSFPQADEQASEKMLGGELGETLHSTAEFLQANQQIDQTNDLTFYQKVLYPNAAKTAANKK